MAIDDPWEPTVALRWRGEILEQKWTRRRWRWSERYRNGVTSYEEEWRPVEEMPAEQHGVAHDAD